MERRDYYEILQVERTATTEEIKRSYRKLAMMYHPDKNPGDKEAEEKFKEAAEAYDVLRDPEKRTRYDRFGHAGVHGNGQGGFSSTDDIFSHFGDIFGDLFGFTVGGSRARGPRPRQGNDLRYNLSISFRQAAKGDSVKIRVPRHVTCSECKGEGTAPGTHRETCKQCNGAGQVRHNQGFFQISVPCPVCHGQGTSIPHPCPACRGEGIQQETRELAVNIPAGVDTGNRLRLRGEGEAGSHGGPPGDLYVVINVQEDQNFERDGQNLLITKTISFTQAILGDKIDVETLDETITLDIPRGTQSNEIFRIAGKGLPYPGRNMNGDLLIEVKVLIPSSVSDKQEELLREFDKLEEQKTLNKAKKIIKKVGKAMGID